MVKWRIQSPQRTRTFSTFKSVEEEGLDAVYAQIYTAVRPSLLRRISDRRSVLEGNTPPMKRKAAIAAAEEPLVTPARPRRPVPPARRKTIAAGKPNAAPLTAGGMTDMPPPPPRPAKMSYQPLPPPSGYGGASMDSMATQRFVDPRQQGGEAPQGKSAWACGCDAHLRRHPQCVFGGLQPALVHLRDYMLVGRGDSCDVILNSRRTPQMISRCHAVVHREDAGFALVDQGSLNGVLVNGEAVRGRSALKGGDVITFGVPSSQPEFDYIFEERPQGLAKGLETQQPFEGFAQMATQLHLEEPPAANGNSNANANAPNVPPAVAAGGGAAPLRGERIE
mmetsp:Transcript_67121/g.140206  ORF Transcript_67121/g.140206 Transcript_67121/m.140206 type:complete len:337 (-) Transcript_67121:627-1637(-)